MLRELATRPSQLKRHSCRFWQARRTTVGGKTLPRDRRGNSPLRDQLIPRAATGPPGGIELIWSHSQPGHVLASRWGNLRPISGALPSRQCRSIGRVHPNESELAGQVRTGCILCDDCSYSLLDDSASSVG
jgi:hypothetical protein